MGARFSCLAVVGLFAVAGPASAAQSLVNGEDLQYNYAYRCNGERIIVARCRDDSDQSYCQVVYPDRPELNGTQVAPVEQRGTIVAKLDGCMRPKQTIVASNHSGTPPRGNTTAEAIGTPGLAKASWSILDRESDNLVLYIKTRMKRAGKLASGWFTTVNSRPKDYPDFNFKDVQFEQYRFEADCLKGTVRMTAYTLFNDEGKPMFSYSGASKWDTMEPGSVGDRKFKVLCGKPQVLADKSPLVGDGDYLAIYAAALLEHGK